MAPARRPRPDPRQGEVVPDYRYHPGSTDSPLTLVWGRSPAPRHAIIDQTNADLIAGALAHLPAGN